SSGSSTTSTGSTASCWSAADGRWLAAHRARPAPQAFLEVDLRLPAENLAGAGDVRPAHLRVVDRHRLEDDLARRARHPDARLGELEHRQLPLRVPDVDGEVLLARREQVEPANQVVDV